MRSQKKEVSGKRTAWGGGVGEKGNKEKLGECMESVQRGERPCGKKWGGYSLFRFTEKGG